MERLVEVILYIVHVIVQLNIVLILPSIDRHPHLGQWRCLTIVKLIWSPYWCSPPWQNLFWTREMSRRNSSPHLQFLVNFLETYENVERLNAHLSFSLCTPFLV